MPVQGGEGIGQFFRALAMGPAMRQQAERNGRLSAYEEMLAEAKAQGERQRAIKERNINTGRGGLASALTAAGMDQNVATAIQMAAQGEYDLRQGTGAAGDLQDQLMARDARDALARGDFQGANASLAALQGKPLQITDEQNGVLLNPYDSVKNQQLRVTPVGQAEIGLRGAQASQARAGAAENMAQAGLANARTANVRSGGENVSGGGRGAGGKPFNIEGGVLGLLDVPLKDASGKPVIDPKTGQQMRGQDPAEIARFFQFAQERANRGGGTNLDGALMDYLQGRELTPEPKIIDPTQWQPAPQGAPDGALIRDKRDGRTYRVIRGYLAPEN